MIIRSWHRALGYLTKLCLAVFILTLIAGEFGCFYRASTLWQLPTSLGNNSLRMLVIADPQVLGYYGEKPGILGSIIRWDADMYLRKSFITVMQHVKPDLILFLGDLLNEGFDAQDQEFREYKARFDWIFSYNTPIPRITMAGDNDIGGESSDVMTRRVLSRHKAAFGPLNHIINTVEHFQIIVVNTVSFLREPDNQVEWEVFHETQDFVRRLPSRVNPKLPLIVLTHAGLSPPRLYFETETEKKTRIILKTVISLNPAIAMSGHVHKAKRNHYKSASPAVDFWEFVIPTCSYRMGTKAMGFGVVVIDSTGKYKTSILSLPPRYLFFWIYLVLLTATTLTLVLYFVPCRALVSFFQICYGAR